VAFRRLSACYNDHPNEININKSLSSIRVQYEGQGWGSDVSKRQKILLCTGFGYFFNMVKLLAMSLGCRDILRYPNAWR